MHAMDCMCCPHCSKEVVPGVEHSCFIQPIRPKKLESKYIFFNLEKRFENGDRQAIFTYAMTYSGESFAAEGYDCVERLLRNFRRPKYTGYTWLAHNYSGCSDILLQHFSNFDDKPEITMEHSKLISLYDKAFEQRFIDSYSFIPMPLAETTAALNLKTSEKGYFPHKFNTPENDFYCGPYPDRMYYRYNFMSDEKKAIFDEWYDEASKSEFDFRKELYAYGRNKVILLREACMKYRKEFIDCTGLDPFSETTLACSCMAVFKTHYLPPDTLALTHSKACVTAHTEDSIEWLEFVKDTRNADVQHALNSGEVQVGKYHLNGYYEKDGVKHDLEFFSCGHYGHDCRYDLNHLLNPSSKTPYWHRRKIFENKVAYLTRTHGFEVEVMWDCQWRQAKLSDPVMDFMSTYAPLERLKPRDGVFEGRANVYKLYHKAEEGEKIRVIDFTSLYLACQSKCEYPTHHPQIILKDFEPLENYFGLIKATVVPPRKLLHPVLPYRWKGKKLMFPLCRTCAEEDNQTPGCSHSDGERALSGCWVSLELMKAIEKGYVVTRVDEVWHFPQRSDSLFSNYVKTFLQYKQEAGGYPAHVVTKGEKRAYIEDYFQKEGIRLNPAKICVNKARHTVNRLLLSSLWDSFSVREKLFTTALVEDPEQFRMHMFGGEHAVTYFSVLSHDVALVQWRSSEDDCAQTPDMNVFVEAFTAAHARLKTYELLDKLGERLLYIDTDSIVYVSKDGDWEPPLGPYLGGLTDRLGDGDYVTEFCAGRLKTYGYHTATGKTHMSPRSETSKESLDKLIDRTRTMLTCTDNMENKKPGIPYNYSCVLLPDYSTLPYGY